MHAAELAPCRHVGDGSLAVLLVQGTQHRGLPVGEAGELPVEHLLLEGGAIQHLGRGGGIAHRVLGGGEALGQLGRRGRGVGVGSGTVVGGGGAVVVVVVGTVVVVVSGGSVAAVVSTLLRSTVAVWSLAHAATTRPVAATSPSRRRRRIGTTVGVSTRTSSSQGVDAEGQHGGVVADAADEHGLGERVQDLVHRAPHQRRAGLAEVLEADLDALAPPLVEPVGEQHHHAPGREGRALHGVHGLVEEADGRAWDDAEVARLLRADQQGGGVAGAGEADRPLDRVDVAAQHRDEVTADVPEVVDRAQDLGGLARLAGDGMRGVPHGAMTAAAVTPRPTTSPTTTVKVPSPSLMTSYQSPPISVPSAPGK